MVDENKLMATVQNGASRTIHKGFVFIYLDKYYSKLLGVCELQVHSLTHISFTVRAGEEYDYTIQVHNMQNAAGETPVRTIELFSSDPELIYPPFGKKRNV